MAASRISESRAAESSVAVSTAATAGATSATEELDSTGATEGALTATEDELKTTNEELCGSATEELDTAALERATLLDDFALDFLDAELAGAFAEELAGTTAELTGAGAAGVVVLDAELAGAGAVAEASSSNSANRSRTCANESWARERLKNKGKRANLRI
jgi:hypothetical protein